jgi:hypothetical protein
MHNNFWLKKEEWLISVNFLYRNFSAVIVASMEYTSIGTSVGGEPWAGSQLYHYVVKMSGTLR